MKSLIVLGFRHAYTSEKNKKNYFNTYINDFLQIQCAFRHFMTLANISGPLPFVLYVFFFFQNNTGTQSPTCISATLATQPQINQKRSNALQDHKSFCPSYTFFSLNCILLSLFFPYSGHHQSNTSCSGLCAISLATCKFTCFCMLGKSLKVMATSPRTSLHFRFCTLHAHLHSCRRCGGLLVLRFGNICMLSIRFMLMKSGFQCKVFSRSFMNTTLQSLLLFFYFFFVFVTVGVIVFGLLCCETQAHLHAHTIWVYEPLLCALMFWIVTINTKL